MKLPTMIALAAVAAVAACAPPASGQAISPNRISAHVKALADDGMEGRQPGTPGGEKATDYVIAAFKAAGLEPAGVDGGWIQPVLVDFNTIAGPVSASLATAGQRTPLSSVDDIAVQARRTTSRVEVKDAPMVFVGYAIGRPELGWDDFKGVDLNGKVAVALFGAPKAAPKAGDLDSFDTAAAKRAEFARRGAVGVVFLNVEQADGWVEARAAADQPQISLPQAGYAPVAPPLTAILNEAPANALLAGYGLSVAQLLTIAEARDFRPIALVGASISVAFDVTSRAVESANVLGRVRGRRQPDETVIYSAHWDHIGRTNTPYIDRNPPARPGDAIYNGAIDNAAGVGALLEVARNIAQGPRPDRSVLFIAFTEEETGHLGAQHYLVHPLVPLETTAALLNFDVVSLLGPTQEISVQGAGRTTLEDDLARLAQRRGLKVQPASTRRGIYRRSDHYQFARYGVPVLYIHGGSTPIDPADRTPEKQAYASSYMTSRYHNVTDEWTPQLDFRGAAQHVQLMLDLGRQLANSAAWPGWKPGVDFASVRSRTDAARVARGIP